MGSRITLAIDDNPDLTPEDWEKTRAIHWRGHAEPVINEFIRSRNVPLTDKQTRVLCGGRDSPIWLINKQYKAANTLIGARTVERRSNLYRLYRLKTAEATALAKRKALTCMECGYDQVLPDHKFCPNCGCKNQPQPLDS